MLIILICSLLREKGKLEAEKESLNERVLNQDTELKKVKKDLQENREKLKRSDEVRWTMIEPTPAKKKK